MFCFLKTSFVHSRSGTYYAVLLECFGLSLLPDILHYVYQVLTEISAPDSSHKIDNKFFIDHCQSWKKVRSCVKLFNFFRGLILIRLTWNLSRFVPNSVEIHTWNFRKKIFWENFSEIFVQTKDPLPKLVKFRPTFWNFYSASILRWKIHTSTFICCLHPSKEARPYTNNKKKIRGRKARTFCFQKTSFVHFLSGTYYALLLGNFGLKFLPDVRHCVYWVFA